MLRGTEVPPPGSSLESEAFLKGSGPDLASGLSHLVPLATLVACGLLLQFCAFAPR